MELVLPLQMFGYTTLNYSNYIRQRSAQIEQTQFTLGEHQPCLGIKTHPSKRVQNYHIDFKQIIGHCIQLGQENVTLGFLCFSHSHIELCHAKNFFNINLALPKDYIISKFQIIQTMANHISFHKIFCFAFNLAKWKFRKCCFWLVW